MRKYCCLYIVAFVSLSCGEQVSQEKDIEEIKIALNKCAEDWSSGNIEAFMDVYWKSDKLQFIGKNGINYGWTNALNNYKKKYPTPYHTGTLTFKVLSTDYLAKNLYSLTGEYYLRRKSSDLNGVFTLIFKKIDGKWVIVSDHTQ
ncbi:DUF4440 domain-containing protein [Lutibacter sp.]|uniref:DUF4440 domain-containing protein n=1 Tax=Lutibacter sp. TaxID=1925666 RepID=UPI003568B377